jgi:hypothetical protein
MYSETIFITEAFKLHDLAIASYDFVISAITISDVIVLAFG